jgi:hypothetical protein
MHSSPDTLPWRLFEPLHKLYERDREGIAYVTELQKIKTPFTGFEFAHKRLRHPERPSQDYLRECPTAAAARGCRHAC